MVYSSRSGITGLTSLLLTPGIEHLCLVGRGQEKEGADCPPPRGLALCRRAQPTQPMALQDKNMTTVLIRGLQVPLSHCGLLGIDLSVSMLPADWRLYLQCVDCTEPYISWLFLLWSAVISHREVYAKMKVKTEAKLRADK